MPAAQVTPGEPLNLGHAPCHPPHPDHPRLAPALAVAVPCVPGVASLPGSLEQLGLGSSISSWQFPAALPSPNALFQADLNSSPREGAGPTMLVLRMHLAQPLAAPGTSGPWQAAELTLPPSAQTIAPFPWPLPLPPQPHWQPASCPVPPPPPRDLAPSLELGGAVGSAPATALAALSSAPAPWHRSWVRPHAATGTGQPQEPTHDELGLPEPPRRWRSDPQEVSSPSPRCPGHRHPSNPPCPRRSARTGSRRTEERRGVMSSRGG